MSAICNLRRVIALLVICACGQCWPQVADSRPAAPPIIIQLPDDIPPESVWIQSMISGPGGGTGGLVKTRPNVYRYKIYTSVRGGPARSAKIVVYAPRCQFQTFEPVLSGTSDVIEQFVCMPLPEKIVHGFLPPAQFPRPYYPEHKKIEVSGYLEDGWMCFYLMTQHFGARSWTAGSCLQATAPLGKLGEIDPEQGGAFTLSLPDFASDPVYTAQSKAAGARSLGKIHLVLGEEKIGRPMAGMRPEGSPPGSGLEVQANYGTPIRFTAASASH